MLYFSGIWWLSLCQRQCAIEATEKSARTNSFLTLTSFTRKRFGASTQHRDLKRILEYSEVPTARRRYVI